MLSGCVDWPDEFVARYREAGYWRGECLGEMLRARARAAPTRLAVVDGARRWTYQELDERADRMAAGLRRLGIAKEQRVLVQLPNIAEFLPLCFALFRIGAIPVLALPAHRETEIVHLAELSQSVAYVIADVHVGFDHRALARAVCKKVASLRHVLVVGDAQEFVSLSEVDAPAEDMDGPAPRDVALLLLSGGTTGAPKLIPRTHDDYVCNVRLSAEVTGLNESTRYLVSLPIAHNFALGCPGALGTLHAGGTVVFCKDPSPETAFRLIEKEKITVTALIPPLVVLWLEAAEWVQADLSSLQWLQAGGARLKAETAARVRPVLGCGLQQVYGMAEGLLNFTRLDDPESMVINTQGRPVAADDEVRIVDASDVEVADGEIGELQVRGPYTIRGYYRADDYNRRAFTADGFYRSGDLVRRLPSGHLVVEGRSKDVINRGGEKVPVEEIENYLMAHPAVRDVAIVGIPDPTMGERTCACIIPRGKAPALAEVNAYLSRLGVAAFKLPDRLVVLESFPQTSVGKVNKRALAKQVCGAPPAMITEVS
ncbi:2,3-dihydroxybenzoate-AMP ligase [Sorangium cellulosum]|uniref:2,3-dihydroxybenzoate-AMP ligase n=2 Tax=Sorangium cellulosum TaxID=56 RepID=A0A150PMP0_SORCE|nr:2,3-dihydroxybenzoate-AMP ligase [Sorangium cellulosum]